MDHRSRSKCIALNFADERAKRASKAISWCDALVLACFWALVISYPHALMNSCPRALQSSCPLAIVPPSSRIGKNQVARCYFVIWLLVSSSLTLPPSSLFIPSESIRSLSNSLPVLARTGFENRAPVDAKRSVLEIKVLVSSRRKFPCIKEPLNKESLLRLNKEIPC